MRGFLFAAALCGLVGPAAADPDAQATPSFALTWSAPPECPTAADFRAEFDKLAAAGDLSRMAVTVEVSKVEDSYALLMTARQGDTSGERALADKSCVELVRAGAVVLALAVVPTLATAPVEPAEPEQPEAPPEPEADQPRVADVDRGPPDTEEVGNLLSPRRDVDAAAPTPTRRRVRATVRTDAGIVTGVVPGPSPGLAIALGLGAGRIRAEAIGWLVPEQKKRMSVEGDVLGGDFDAVAFGARVCGAVVHRPVGGASFELCAGGEYLRLRGAGVGIDSPASATDDLFAIETAAAVSFPITRRLVLRSGLSGLWYPKRSIYELTTTTPGQPPEVLTVHETAAISGRLTIGLGISL